jgi:hypothetical protein
MSIGTDDAILKFGTQAEVTSGTPATIASNAYGKADQAGTVAWTNADDAETAAAVLKCQFDTTMPTVGRIGLYAHLLNVQSTNDLQVPSANFPHVFCGVFPIPFNVAADTDFYTAIPDFIIPSLASAQAIDWYLRNDSTGQTIGVSWQLWITPKAVGPHA